MEYNPDNVFYKIIHKELNTDLVLEGKYFIAINDIKPKAPVHVLIISKNNYVDYTDFIRNAASEEIIEFNQAIVKVVDLMKLQEGGYRLISNSGKFGQQEVPHVHVHVLGKSSEE